MGSYYTPQLSRVNVALLKANVAVYITHSYIRYNAPYVLAPHTVCALQLTLFYSVFYTEENKNIELLLF